MYQDFNYAVSDSAWIHLEFESDAITKEDLRRFREYEAATSRTYKVEVITYVICSARVKHPMTMLKERVITAQAGLRIYCADRKKVWWQQASGPSRSDFIGRMR